MNKEKKPPKLPASWIELAKKLNDIRRAVEIKQRLKLARYLKKGVDVYGAEQVEDGCATFGMKRSTVRELVKIATVFPKLPKYVVEGDTVSWTHVRLCTRYPDLLKVVHEKKLSVAELVNIISKKSGGAPVRPRALVEQCKTLTRKLVKLDECPKQLENAINNLIEACEYALSL